MFFGSTNITCNSGSYTHSYGGILRYDTLAPASDYGTDDLINVSSISCVNSQCQNASFFTNLYVDNEFITFINSCSHRNGVEYANISHLNVRSISYLGKLNVSIINASLITDLSGIYSGLNQNLAIIANQINESLNTNVCFY